MKRKKVASFVLLFVLVASALLPGAKAVATDKANIFDYIHREPWMKPGGTFRWPMLGEANTLNPFTYTSSWEFMILDMVYDTLTEMTPDMKYVGRLAKDWSVSEDGKVWTFELFQNATWHDGKPVTAEDVAFTYNLLAEIGTQTRFADYAVVIDRAEVVDKYTVKIYLKEPYAPFLYSIASSIYIVPEHIWKNIDKTEIIQYKNEHPIGSGPFIFVEHKPQQYYKLKVNTNYHLGRPLIDEIIMPIISNPDAMLLAFKKGEVDVMTWSIPYSSIPQVEEIPDAHLHAVTEFGARFMYFNCQRWPTSEVKFRQAVHHAINQTEVVKIVYQGHALPGSLGRIPPTLTKWYNPNLPSKEEKYPYDLKKAAQLLDEIGFKDVDGDGWREAPDGSDVTLTLYSPSYDPLRVRWGQMIADNLKKIGVNVKYQPLEWTTLSNYLDSGNFDMLIIGGIGSLDPDILRMLFHSKGGWNNGHCVIPGLDELLDKQKSIVDYEERKKIIYEVQEILAENVPLLNMVHQQFIYAYSTKNWDGWTMSDITGPDNWFSIMNLYNKEINKQPLTSASEQKTTASETSAESQTTTKTETEGGICGPASLLGLALIPILLRRRK